jgi:hypothetical protein
VVKQLHVDRGVRRLTSDSKIYSIWQRHDEVSSMTRLRRSPRRGSSFA